MAEPTPTFTSAPPDRIDLGQGAVLVRCRPERAAAAVAAINASLDHLRPWMAWAAEPATETGMATFFAVTHPDHPIQMLMKVPVLSNGEDPAAIVGFEMEQMILPRIEGQHVPRFIAAGDFVCGDSLLQA